MRHPSSHVERHSVPEHLLTKDYSPTAPASPEQRGFALPTRLPSAGELQDQAQPGEMFRLSPEETLPIAATSTGVPTKERPILFSGEMVRALLDGRKTQTRRTIAFPRRTGAFVCVQGFWQNQPEAWWPLVSLDGESMDDGTGCESPMACPYGKPGDRLWVREAWRAPVGLDSFTGKQIGANAIAAGYKEPWAPLTFLADGRVVHGEVMRPGLGEFGTEFGRYRHARFMPRWASRITLEVTEVRVQRLQDITAADALAEGVGGTTFWTPKELDGKTFEEKWWDDDHFWGHYPRLVFQRLWGSLHGEDGWADNPWVWAVGFKVLPQQTTGEVA